MKVRKKKQKQKKLKSDYYFIDDNNEILGKTDNPCRTMINLFTVFENKGCRKVFFDIDNKRKKIMDRENCLQLLENKNKTIYKYQNKAITRKEFIILLGCEEK